MHSHQILFSVAFLFRQEDVHNGTYRAIQVIVETPGGQLVNCLSYELLKLSAKDLRPSPQYMDVILRGARKNGLPKDYVATLETIETNGYSGEMETYNDVLKLLGEKSWWRYGRHRFWYYTMPLFNSLWPSDAIWRQGSGSTLAQVMACCLMAPSHYLNQCWLIICEVQ